MRASVSGAPDKKSSPVNRASVSGAPDRKSGPVNRASVSGAADRKNGPVNRVSVSEPLDRQIAAAIRASVSTHAESSTKVEKGVQMSPRASSISDMAARTSPRMYTAGKSVNEDEFPTYAKPAVNYGFREGRNHARRASQPVTQEEKEMARKDLEAASYDPPERIPSILTHVIPRRETSPAPYTNRESFSPIGWPPEPPL